MKEKKTTPEKRFLFITSRKSPHARVRPAPPVRHPHARSKACTDAPVMKKKTEMEP